MPLLLTLHSGKQSPSATLERNRINFVVPDANQIEERERATSLVDAQTSPPSEGE